MKNLFTKIMLACMLLLVSNLSYADHFFYFGTKDSNVRYYSSEALDIKTLLQSQSIIVISNTITGSSNSFKLLSSTKLNSYGNEKGNFSEVCYGYNCVKDESTNKFAIDGLGWHLTVVFDLTNKKVAALTLCVKSSIYSYTINDEARDFYNMMSNAGFTVDSEDVLDYGVVSFMGKPSYEYNCGVIDSPHGAGITFVRKSVVEQTLDMFKSWTE